MIYCPTCLGPHITVGEYNYTVYQTDSIIVKGGTCKDCGCQFRIIKEGIL